MIKVEDPSSYTDIGKQAIEKASKINNDTVEVRELSKEMNKDYMTTLIDTALKDKSKYEGNYYVVILTKRERLIKRVLRNLFFTRQSCPTPSYEQTVYKFDPKEESLEFLWIVPSKGICKIMYKQRHAIEIQSDALLPYVIDFYEGKLMRKAMELNKEG
ncbi:MAG TPA: hypothetical protein VMV86_00615 [Methanosarcinales archaeon]|nr:hypothetical protein [Methanosarcinales archaeon]